MTLIASENFTDSVQKYFTAFNKYNRSSEMKFAVVLFFALYVLSAFAQSTVNITGNVTNSETRLPLINANVFVERSKIGSVTDSSGRYNLHLSPGSYVLKFSYVGFEPKRIILKISSSDKIFRLDAALDPMVIEQKQVDIIGERYPSSTLIRRVKGENIKKMPTVFDDVLRSVKILPGVVSNDELSSGYNVRGGNYDQNLIYLNGFEIHRPFLIKEGLEENQSLLNQDMVNDLQFFAGAFPANFGDKISSALNVNYSAPEEYGFKISAKVDLLKINNTVSYRRGNLGLITGLRFAYPSLLGDVLQRKGDYKPEFKDLQAFGTYKLTDNSEIELLAVLAKNNFSLSPSKWTGHFQLRRFDVREVSIDLEGNRDYSFLTGLLGLTFNYKLSTNSKVNFSAMLYDNNETEKNNISEEIYFVGQPGQYNSSPPKFLKSRYNFADNELHLTTYELKSVLNYFSGIHSFEIGIDGRFSMMTNQVNEAITESGPDSTLELPYKKNYYQNVTFSSISFYALDQIVFNEKFQANIGIRANHSFYNSELVISPRAAVFYIPSVQHTINLSFGYYLQPPFAYELKNNLVEESEKLKSQKAFHYVIGWEYRSDINSKYQFELFYKKMNDLIPYNIEKMQVQYIGSNDMEGYAAGFDFQYEGEIIKGMKSWIGYSFLDARERFKESGEPYRRSLIDQRHTVKVFLQDRMRKLPNFQSHVRFLFGSGLVYHPKEYRTDKESGMTYLAYNMNKVLVFPFYFRIDMGLSFDFKIGSTSNVVIIAEVLNVFDKNNIADFNWYKLYPLTYYPTKVPQIFSKRFFNLAVSLTM